jgi:predicted transcriptional regulator
MSTNYEPYSQNARGLSDVLIDLKDTLSGRTVFSVAGFGAIAFEDVAQGDAVYSRASDGKVGKATNNGTLDQAVCIGVVQATKTAGQEVRVLVTGISASSGLNPGDIVYLGVNGAITDTPPTGPNKYLTRIGEATKNSQLSINLSSPILLS